MSEVVSGSAVVTGPAPARPRRDPAHGAGLAGVAGEMAVSLVGLGAGRGLGFVVQVLLARGLGPASFGLYVLATTVLRMAEILGRVGMDTGAIRFVSTRMGDKHAIREVSVGTLAAVLLASSVTGLGLFSAAAYLSERVFDVGTDLVTPIRLIALFVPASAGLAVGAALTRGFRKTRYTVLARDVAQPVVQTLILLGLLVGASVTVESALLSFGLSLAAALGLAVFFLHRLCGGLGVPARAALARGREVVGYSAPLLLVGGIHFFITWLDTLLLGLYRGPADVGVYRAAVQVPLMLPVLLAASNSIYGPTASALLHRGDRAEASVLLRTTSRWLAWLSIPAFAVMFVCAGDIVAVFGEGYREVGPTVLRVFAVAQLFSVATGGVGQTLTLTGHQRIEVYNSIGMVVLNVLLCVTLIPLWGARGAAAAGAVSIIGLNAARMVQVRSIYRMGPFDRTSAWLAGAGIAALLLAWAVRGAVGGILGAGAATLVVAAVFVPAVLWRGTTPEDGRIYRKVRARLDSRSAGTEVG